MSLEVRARFGTAVHFCEVVVLKLRTATTRKGCSPLLISRDFLVAHAGNGEGRGGEGSHQQDRDFPPEHPRGRDLALSQSICESGPLRAVHLSRHTWPGGLVNQDSAVLSTWAQEFGAPQFISVERLR